MTQARVLLRLGIERAAGKCDEGARRINVSKSLMTRMLAGERNIAPDVARRMAQMHPLNALALASEVTGYSCFRYDNADRHPLALLYRLLKEDKEADEVMSSLPETILGKLTPESLTVEDTVKLKHVVKEISERIAADLNLLVEIEDRYRIGVWDVVGQTENAPAIEPRQKERPLKTAAQ